MILGTSTFFILAAALVLDSFIGDPDWLWTKVRHPVALFGALISRAEKRFNRGELSDVQREKNGFVVIAVLLIVMVLTGWLISLFLTKFGWFGAIIEVIIVAVFLAQKSLADHVAKVADGLRKDDLETARGAVAMIVGRNPHLLDEAGISRASIESLAENASDGVIAPAFWYAVFGFPGLFVYKMLNTADSMIGHKSERFRAFGRASAKFDDFANWLPARLTGLLILLAGGFTNIEDNFRVMMRDAKLHRSPNAGWPESAMAAACDLALGGPRIYDGDIADEPYMNDVGRKNANENDINAALRIFWRTMTIGTVLIFIFALTSAA